LLRCRGIGIDGSRRDLEVCGEADQQLLHTVVEGALEAAAFNVVRQGESLARRAKLRDLAAQRVELSIGPRGLQGDRPPPLSRDFSVIAAATSSLQHRGGAEASIPGLTRLAP
jgi:hypothetical protein